MRIFNYSLRTLLIFIILTNCGSSSKSTEQNTKTDTSSSNAVFMNSEKFKEKLIGISDPTVTGETVALFDNLKSIAKRGVIFGQHTPTLDHQDGTYKVNKDLKSDCFTAVQSHPGIFNYDFARHNASFFKTQVEEVYRRGGIISYSWHAINPVTLENYKDTTQNPVQSILSNGIGWENWKSKLDEIAYFLNNLSLDGVKIPVIFRPFHEHTGSWFWWGAKHCTSEEYVALWQKTIDYLRHKGVNNMLLAYSPSKPSQHIVKSLETYPGDDYVDIIGFDAYHPKSSELQLILTESVSFVADLAKEKNKVAAITEVGVTKGLQNSDTNDWYMATLLEPLQSNIKMSSIAFVTTWFNIKPDAYWVPLPGQANYKSFADFYKDSSTFFLNDLSDMYILK